MRDRVLFLILLFSLFPGRGTGEALNDAAAAQRQAIAELIQSLKSARRILSTRPPDPGSGTSGVKPVFRDRQTFLLPEMPPSANPAEQLNARIEEQKRLLDEMRRTPGSDAAAREKLMRQQREIREKTPSKTGSPLPRETARHLERAENAMKESENMLRSGRSSMAQTAAQKALADLKRAAGEIDVNGDRKMQRSLSAAQREMERLAGRSGKGSSTPTQQEALRALAERLLADALNQHRTGKQSHAETLAELAKQIHDAATSTPAASLADLTARIRALRMEGRNARLVLEERLTALEELSQQLRYIAGHPETLDAPARTLLHDDLQTELELTELALEQLKLADPGNTALAGSAVRAGKLRRAPATVPPDGDALKFADEITTLCREIRQHLNRLQAAEHFYLFHPDDVPARYREDVAKYFERLSELEERRQEKEPKHRHE